MKLIARDHLFWISHLHGQSVGQKCHQGNRSDCQFCCLWTILKRCSFPETLETRREKIKNHETHTRVVIISMSVTISYKSLHICHHTTRVCAFVYRNVGKAYFKLIRISFIWKPICNFKMLLIFQASLFD